MILTSHLQTNDRVQRNGIIVCFQDYSLDLFVDKKNDQKNLQQQVDMQVRERTDLGQD